MRSSQEGTGTTVGGMTAIVLLTGRMKMIKGIEGDTSQITEEIIEDLTMTMIETGAVEIVTMTEETSDDAMEMRGTDHTTLAANILENAREHPNRIGREVQDVVELYSIPSLAIPCSERASLPL
jgi:hypothetical protein